MSDGQSDTGGATHAATLRIPESLWREIRVMAAQEDKSASAWIRDALVLVVQVKKEASGE